MNKERKHLYSLIVTEPTKVQYLEIFQSISPISVLYALV